MHFDVSNVRVGQRTDFDKLEIIMETDGGLTGQEAMDIAAHILVDHFTMMFSADFGKIESPVADSAETVIGEETAALEPEGENEIQSSALSTRAKNALVKNGITTMAALNAQTSDQISNLSGLGDKTIKEIIEFLKR